MTVDDVLDACRRLKAAGARFFIDDHRGIWVRKPVRVELGEEYACLCPLQAVVLLEKDVFMPCTWTEDMAKQLGLSAVDRLRITSAADEFEIAYNNSQETRKDLLELCEA